MRTVLVRSRPRVIFIPHGSDGHPAHVGTHLLVMDALKILPAAFPVPRGGDGILGAA